MFKVRYVVITLMVTYVFAMFISILIESQHIRMKGKEMDILVRIAADMAIQTAVASDDYFRDGADGMLLYAANSHADSYTAGNPYEVVFGSGLTEDIYDKVFTQNSAFQLFASKTVNIKTPFYNGVDWEYVPSIAQMGEPSFPSTTWGAFGVSSGEGSITELYGLNKKSFSGYSSTGEDYFYTPLNLGVTYLDVDLLDFLFKNNLDLLMRAKYVNASGNGIAHGVGLYESPFYSRVSGSIPNEELRIINNGRFSYLRGQLVSSAGVGSAAHYDTVNRVKVEYKVIDALNPANEALLEVVFGAYKGSSASKGQYLLSQSTKSPEHLNGSLPVVVARIVFPAEFIVPYETPVVRGWRMEEGGLTNYTNFTQSGASTTLNEYSAEVGGIVHEYVTYFAVMP